MIRTKYLFIAVCFCLLVILSAGFWSVTTHPYTVPSLQSGAVIFANPQESYPIVVQSSKNTHDEREVFISKVQATLAKEPRREAPSPEPVVQQVGEVTPEAPVSAPVAEAQVLMPAQPMSDVEMNQSTATPQSASTSGEMAPPQTAP
jgi:hypothetical protein